MTPADYTAAHLEMGASWEENAALLDAQMTVHRQQLRLLARVYRQRCIEALLAGIAAGAVLGVGICWGVLVWR